jgi:hypothetical protein
MKSILRNLALGVAVLTLTVTAVSGSSTFSAFAQTTAPSASVPLPEDTIKALQEALSGQGIAVTASGVLDDGTREAIRQYQSQHHLPVTGEPDKATLDKLGVGGQASALPEGSQGTGEASPGQAVGGMGPGMMGMMTPQMMQMMQNMMGQGGMGGMMGGMAGQGMPKGGMGQGMMCPMMQMMMGGRGGMGMAGGPGMHLGMPGGTQEEMTPERVRTFVEEHLTRQGNPRLKLGEVATAADGSITAEIVTVDGSLVQKLAFNRYPGLFRQIVE